MRILPQLCKNVLIAACLLFGTVFSVYLPAQTSPPSPQDSVLENVSIDELVKLKKMLEQEKNRIIQQQKKDLQRGVNLSKDFLTKNREENENQDMILARVAEYYIEEARRKHDEAVAEYDRQYGAYEKQLEAFRQGKIKVEPEAPAFPQINFEKVIGIYDLILINFPESDLADDALYNKAFLLSEMEETEASQQVFLELIDKYPESEYAPEAYIQLAEYYFQPQLGQGREETIRNLNKAAQLYKNVLKYKESPRYDEALYKLGWTYYRLAAVDPDYYSDAILYYTMVVKDVEKFKELDPEGKYIKANIEPEALQYLAASFVDTAYTLDGVKKASNYIRELGQPSYGVDILSYMGEQYARIVDYDNSIRAFETLLNMYPEYPHAPLIRNKIADVYEEANQPEKAYQERQNLFTDYNPKTEWYARIEQSDLEDRISILDEVTRLTEASLRSNVITQYNRARRLEESDGDSLGAYQEFARLSRIYLETYPTHENAYEINWSLAYVLDTELHGYSDAFEEYLRVSNDYLETEHREDAATNAIAVAQTAVNLEKTTQDTAQLGGMDLSQLTAQELAPQEKMLAEAFDNYIKLFPNQEKTVSYLSSAGALYYQHHQYALARKYYKTMVTKFPEAQQRSVGLLSLMNSYFFLGKFKDAEFVAKKILEVQGIPQDQKEVAQKRVWESIYKNAEKLEQEEKYLEAAREFYRVYKESRTYRDIVDLALFNSAQNYEKTGEWQQAINMYDTLVVNFEDSEYRLIALGKIAEDYKQMEDFASAGSTYERIYRLYPERDDAEAALYNASLFYAQAKSWSDAIRVNNTYIKRYPGSADAKDLMFENVSYYLKLDDLENANRIYDEFAQRYPDDRRTIEAYYRRGEYYFNNGQYDLARRELQRAISRSEEFARTGRDPNLYYASEAYFTLGEIEFKEFEEIKLTYPQATLEAQLRRKQDKLQEVVGAFTRVIQMGSLKGFEAMYKVAQAYEKLADAIANQEISPNLSPEESLVASNQVFQASVPAYDRAVEEYKNVIKTIPVYAEKLDISLFDTTSNPAQEETKLIDTLVAIERETISDSTKEVALKWYNRAEKNVSLILYSVAQRSSQFIDAYLRQKNPAEGLVYLSWKKLLLERAVSPAINVTLNAHMKNINISGQLGLENKYVEESKRKILLTSNILADEYGKLVKNAAEIYTDQIPVLMELVESGDNATTPEGFNSLDFNDRMLNTIDYLNEFLTIALKQYENTLKFARENQINNDAVLTTQDRLFNLAYEAGLQILDLAQQAKSKQEQYLALSDSTGDPKYQLGMVFFDDQRSILRDYAQRSLELSYQISKEYEIKNIWTNLILAKLVELKPAEYLGNIPKEIVVITTDTTWLAASEYQMDWILSDFDDSGWNTTSKIKIPFDMVFSGFDTLQSAPPAIWLYQKKPDTTSGVAAGEPLGSELGMQADTADTAASDTVSRPRTLELEEKEIPEEEMRAKAPAPLDTSAIARSAEPDTLTAYFRKHFTVKDRTINGWALITGDDEYHFYLNGEYIKGDDTGIFENVDVVNYLALSDFINIGENVIAIDVTDLDGPPRYGLRFYMQLEQLPVEITAAAERIRRKASESVDPDRLKTIVILNKNRILSQ